MGLAQRIKVQIDSFLPNKFAFVPNEREQKWSIFKLDKTESYLHKLVKWLFLVRMNLAAIDFYEDKLTLSVEKLLRISELVLIYGMH